MLIEALLSRIDAFCAQSGRKEGGVSTILFGDGKKIAQLRRGKQIHVGSLELAHARLDELFAELDAIEAIRSGAARLLRGEVVHPETVPEAGVDCDRNGAGQLRGEAAPADRAAAEGGA